MCYLSLVGAPTAATVPQQVPRADFVLLRRIRDRLDRDCARPLDVEVLSNSFDLPPRSLIRRFEIAYGRTPYGYLVARRGDPAQLS